MKHVALIGLGAMGVLYSDIIAKKMGEDFFVIADENRIKKYEAEGIYCNGERCNFTYRSSANPLSADLLIVGTKFGGLEAAMEEAAAFVTEKTIMISLLNGISSEQMLKERFPQAKVLYCIAQGMDAVKEGNRATYMNKGVLLLGEEDGSISPELQALGDFLDKMDIPHQFREDIILKLWSKLMLNTGVNQVVMVYEGTYRTVQDPGEAHDKMQQAMEEVMQVANAEGIPLTMADVDGWWPVINSLNPDGMPSMRQDGMAKRHSEVELFSGTVIRLAEKHGIDTPVCRWLYETVKAMEANY